MKITEHHIPWPINADNQLNSTGLTYFPLCHCTCKSIKHLLCAPCPFSLCAFRFSFSLSLSVIPQSDLVHWAKSIATLLEPKPRGSAVALYSLTHQKHRHRIMQWSSRQRFRLTNINSSPGAISNEAWEFSSTKINREAQVRSGSEGKTERQTYQTNKSYLCSLHTDLQNLGSPICDGGIK